MPTSMLEMFSYMYDILNYIAAYCLALHSNKNSTVRGTATSKEELWPERNQVLLLGPMQKSK